MDAVVTYFANDPLKLLYLLGGAGGMWFWVDKWLDRVRIRVRLLSHSFDIKHEDVEVTIEFEVVNLGKAPTSLEPVVLCGGYEIHRKHETATLAVQADERLLAPHSTKKFIAIGRAPVTYPFWVFKTFRVAPSRGGARV